VHNFHDVQKALPASVICRFRMSLFPLLFPYMEQQPLYELITTSGDKNGYSGFMQVVSGDGWWSSSPGLDDGKRKSCASVSAYFCPSIGRTAPAMAPPEASPSSMGGYDMSGPQNDYAIVIRGKDNTTVGDTVNWWNFANVGAFEYSSPFRQAICPGLTNDPYSYPTKVSLRDPISWWRDGTSNQLCAGEKNFTRERKPGFYQGYNASQWQYTDQTYFTARGDGLPVISVIRTFDRNDGLIVKAWTDTAGVSEPWSVFGAWHNNTCNFMFGDGSVHGLSTTTSINILRSLACTRDGESVSIP
jgi:prepilin-type processing-associated H-X9-DG protein